MELADSSQGTIPGQSTVSDHTVHSPELRCWNFIWRHFSDCKRKIQL
jgi:hypothetical protein